MTSRHLALGALLLLGFWPVEVRAASVKAARGAITLPTYPWTAVPHPYFRGTDGRNIYPYPMLDNLSREKADRTYRTVVLENEYLRVTFLPELGGKVHEVIDKTTGQPMFYVNHVLKPGLIGQCGAWTSGGIEWNTGPQGHTVSCLQPVDVEILPPARDGSRTVAVGETERIYGTKWTVLVTLRPGRSYLEETLRIYNPTETIRPYYFWNCTAVPNTPGFRFIYPMTLGMDHSGDKFFRWPVHEGKDLTRGTNYQDASSIFAYHCDQDFFGSYNDDLDRGVVSYANHHQLPGKKAWTWGHGGFGAMHQADLTDADGPYNEVQTGPLLTQGEVGRLDPCEAVTWKEWWYPIHGIGGFTFANQDVAVNAQREGTNLNLQILGTGAWNPVEVRVSGGNARELLGHARGPVSPRQPVRLTIGLPPSSVFDSRPLEVELAHGDSKLAAFRVPLEIPQRDPPPKKPSPQTAAEHALEGWQDLLFARFTEAEAQFRKALESDPQSVSARTGLAYLRLDSDPAGAAAEARSALAVDPDFGSARYALAVAEHRTELSSAALDDAWKSALDPARAVAGRALAAKLLIRAADYRGAVGMLSDPGPWQTDPVCRNRLAFALHQLGENAAAVRLARENLTVDPLDRVALSLLWLTGSETGGRTLIGSLQANPAALLDLADEYCELEQD